MKSSITSFFLLLLIGIGGIAFHVAKRHADVPPASHATEVQPASAPIDNVKTNAELRVGAKTRLTRDDRQVKPVGMHPASVTERQLVTRAYLQLPLDFEANKGQAPERFEFVAHAPGYALGLSPGVATLSLQRMGKRANSILMPVSMHGALPEPLNTSQLELRLLGASGDAVVSGEGEQRGRSNYFIGNDSSKWQKQVPHFSRVRMSGVYSGVDLIYYGNPQQLEYDFVVAPGADSKAIHLQISGSRRIYLDRSGNAVLRTAAGAVQLKHPTSYQVIEGVRKSIEGYFRLVSTDQLQIEVGPYDRSKPLVIDPVLTYAVALGGANGNQPTSITGVELDATGNVYVAGSTCATDFPSTAGPFQGNNINVNAKACLVGFVSKLDPKLSTLIFSDFVGGSELSAAWYSAIDSTGNVYVIGTTNSTDFPTVHNAGQTAPPVTCALSKTTAYTCPEAFVFKLTPDGSELLFSSLLGGSQATIGQVLQIDPVTNDVVIMGATNSSDFKPAPTTLLTAFPGGACAGGIKCFETFLFGLNPSTGAFLYGTFVGGTGSNFAGGMEIDNSGSIYLSGSTQQSFAAPLGPVTHTYPPANGAAAGGTDIFVMKLNRSAQNALSVGYTTVIQGELDEGATSLTVDATGNTYLIGSTASQHLPVTAGVLQTTNQDVNGSNCGWATAISPLMPNFCGSVFVSKLGPTGTLSWLTYLGGTGPDTGEAIGQDSDGNLWLGGVTSSSNFPFSNDAYIAPGTNGVGYAPFLAEMSNDGTKLPYASLIAGNFGGVMNITTDSNDNIFVSGYASTVPTTPGVYPSNPQIFEPAFVQEWNAVGKPPALQLSATALTFPDTPIGAVSAAQTVTVQNTGAGPMEFAFAVTPTSYQNAPSADFLVTNNCGATIAANSSCTLSVTFAPGAPAPACLAAPDCVSTSRGAVISVSTNAPGGPQTISAGGTTGNGANVAVAPNPIVFPAQPAGTSSPNTDVFVSNNGDVALYISNVTLTGTNASEFTLSLVTTGPLACTSPVPTGGSACQLEVSFTPAANATGTRTAQLILADGAIGSPQSIPITGTVAGIGSLNVSPVSLNLPPTATGQGTTGGFNISNPGTAAVGVSAFNITGTNPAEFGVTSGSCPAGPPFSLAGGATCFLAVSFTSNGTRGLQTATVALAGPPLSGVPTVALSVDVVNNSDPALKYFTAPSPLDFGALEVGDSTGPLTHVLSIFNALPVPCAGGAQTCGGPLNITSLAAGFADYVVSPENTQGTCTLPPVTIASGNFCYYQIIFTPSAGGSRNTTLNIVSNDPQGTVMIPLLGVGLTLPIASAVPSIVNFGSSQIGVPSPPQTVTLTNSGTGPLAATSLTASANFAVLSNNCNQAVPAGGSCTVTVTATPPSAGSFSGTLTFTNNAAFGGKQAVSLNGTGATGALLVASPSTLTFSGQPTNTTSLRQTVTLTSTGNTAVTFPANAIRLTPVDYQIVSSTCGSSLALGASCAIAITYTASTPDPEGGTLIINDNAQGNPQPVYMYGSGLLNGAYLSTTTLLASANPVGAGQSVTFTASTSGTSPTPTSHTGTVLFLDGSTTIGSALLNANLTASFTTSALNGGTHSITAAYEGNSAFLPSTSVAISEVVTGGGLAATTTAVTSSLNPSTVGASVIFTAAVTSTTTGTITGTVTFMDGATTLGTGTLSAGQATLATSSLTLGSQSITAVYGGDSNFTASTSAALTQTVNASTKAVTTASLGASPNPSKVGQSVTFTATVSSTTAGTITGTITYLDGANSLGTASLGAGGIATFSTSSLTQGSHSITAAYGGDANFAVSTSSPLTQTVNVAPDFTVAVSPSTLTVKAGQSGTLMLNVTPINGATFTLNFACGTLPTKTTCAFTPASVTLDGKDVASSTITIATTANSTGWPAPQLPGMPGWPWIACVAALAVLLATAWRTSSPLPRRVLLASAVLFIGIGMNSCAGGSSNNGTTPGTYPITLTVASTSGGVSHTATATVTVTQ
jgi:hypothetical protein